MGRPDELLLKHVLGSFLVGELRPSGRRRVVSSSMSTTTPPHKHASLCDKAVARARLTQRRDEARDMAKVRRANAHMASVGGTTLARKLCKTIALLSHAKHKN